MLALKEKEIDLIVQFLLKRYPIIIKTDTVWGILCLDAQKLYDMKKRPLDKPFVRLVDSTDTMHNMEDIHHKFVKEFWPGAVTIIKDGISYRMPKDDVLLHIIRSSRNQILYCTSANVHGGDPIKDLVEATRVFGEWGDNAIFVIPSKCKNACRIAKPSTIVDIDKWKILRAGDDERKINLWLYKNVIVPYRQQLADEAYCEANLDLFETHEEKIDKQYKPAFGGLLVDERNCPVHSPTEEQLKEQQTFGEKLKAKFKKKDKKEDKENNKDEKEK